MLLSYTHLNVNHVVDRLNATEALKPEAVLREAPLSGEVDKGRVLRLIDMTERTAHRVIRTHGKAPTCNRVSQGTFATRLSES